MTDLPDQPTAGSSTQADAIQSNVRLPEFNSADPEMWFAMVEAAFTASRVTSDQRKFQYILTVLPPRYANEVRDLILHPPATNAYKTLRDDLTKRLSATEEQKTRRLLEHEEIGDEKPSQFLRRLRRLAGAGFPETMLRTLWIGRLPAAMQPIMATQKNVNLDEAAELADAVAETLHVRPSVSETAVKTPDHHLALQFQQLALNMSQELAVIREEIAAINIHRRYSSRERPRSRSHSRQRSSICWYHQRFGSNARKCTKPCTWTSPPENQAGSR